MDVTSDLTSMFVIGAFITVISYAIIVVEKTVRLKPPYEDMKPMKLDMHKALFRFGLVTLVIGLAITYYSVYRMLAMLGA